MEAKISKAQQEVWEWKDKLYEELKNMPMQKRIDYLLNKVKSTVEQIKKNMKKQKRSD